MAGVCRFQSGVIASIVTICVLGWTQATARGQAGSRNGEWPAYGACRSRIPGQAATGSWTRSLQWETQRTWFKTAGFVLCPPAKVSGVWPSNDTWLRAALE